MTNSDIQRLLDDHELTGLLARPARVTVAGMRTAANSPAERAVGSERDVPCEATLNDLFFGVASEVCYGIADGQPA